ncbi:MAG: glycosyltransferase family 1 protein [Acidobacteriaceae bacterium]|nr:glycosyltransferase family 1 protein [Acidobacteriaceae bacterium]
MNSISISDALATSQSTEASEPKRTLNLLAYVHLRNIHNSTGAGRVARQLTEHLASRNDVRLRVLVDAADKERVLPLVKEPWTTFEYTTFSNDTSKQQARWFWLNSPKAESYWPEADIIFCTGESFVPTKKAKLVVTVHDAAYFETQAHRRDQAFWKQKLKWTMLYRKLAKNADMFHTVSHFSASRLAHFFPTIADRIRVVHNAVAPHFFEAVPKAGFDYLESIRLANCSFVLVPGGLHFRKNADLILAACPELIRRFPDLVIAVVNHSNSEYVEQAKALQPNLRLLGFVEDSSLHALYAAASVVWFPSRYEGFGLPVIEAMACGAPVVASNASSLPEIAGDAAMLVDPSHWESHVRTIHDLLTDDAARLELSRAGRIRASLFTWESSACQIKRHFDSLL